MRNGVKGLALLSILAFAMPAGADTVFDRFDRGQAEFEHKNFGNAITILRGLLYPVDFAWAYYTHPVQVDDDWQVLVSGSPTARCRPA